MNFFTRTISPGPRQWPRGPCPSRASQFGPTLGKGKNGPNSFAELDIK